MSQLNILDKNRKRVSVIEQGTSSGNESTNEKAFNYASEMLLKAIRSNDSEMLKKSLKAAIKFCSREETQY